MNMSPCLAGFLSAICPRGWGGGIFWGANTYSCASMWQTRGSGGMLPWENFDFERFIRRNLVESGTVFAQTRLYN